MINPNILKCSDPKCDEPSLPNSLKCELHEKDEEKINKLPEDVIYREVAKIINEKRN